ncbi:M20/M25/M40 family metallo-hydrolase [Desulfitibacter alkalitolerans]|uniref:M20/M25/M40 family metallo-hydrolase n=1 Tax=Desulfitibacter alkalitolerans TaxID=264641 RepID=UPI000484D1D3|nr:M20/M25/M40 family metallo-hydrolase [Desulfitibacter alkalitolerans]
MNTDFSHSYNYMKNLTIELVKIPSIVRKDNQENAFVLKLKDIILRDIPYFCENPHNLTLVPLENDSFKRDCVLAFMEGAKKSRNTVILLSHLDVVGVGDYGELSGYAFNPELLKEKMKEVKFSFSRDVQDDLESEEWLFGRGVVDMKGGLAQHIWILKELAEHRDTLEGNVLLISVPDEEALAAGAQSAAKYLCNMVSEKDLNLIGLLKSDAMLPRYYKDPDRYIYLGTIGKYLLSYYIYGVAAHAGECMEGFDSNLIASTIVRNMSLNCTFCDEADGEVSPPPVTLKQCDLKEVYNVQIPYESQVYFNYFTYTKCPSEILEIGKKEAQRAMNSLSEEFVRNKEYFCTKAGLPNRHEPLEANIFTFEEIYNKLISRKPYLKAELEEFINNCQYNEADPGKLSLAIVRKVFTESDIFNEKKPCIIVYLSPPYVPRVRVKEKENLKDERFVSAILNTMENEAEKIKLRRFYPYISDISWFAMDDEIEDIYKLMCNTPGFKRTCSIDLKPLTELNIPSANIGPFGKDPHQATERLYMPHAFGEVPKLALKIILKLLSVK